MHTAVQPREGRKQAPQGGDASVSRVAIAGATGYTGQELLRLLARHPGVRIVAAMSSGAQPAAAPRRLPALAHIWTGTVTPLDRDALARDADVCFSPCPTRPPPNWRPRWSRRACV